MCTSVFMQKMITGAQRVAPALQSSPQLMGFVFQSPPKWIFFLMIYTRVYVCLYAVNVVRLIEMTRLPFKAV